MNIGIFWTNRWQAGEFLLCFSERAPFLADSLCRIDGITRLLWVRTHRGFYRCSTACLCLQPGPLRALLFAGLTLTGWLPRQLRAC